MLDSSTDAKARNTTYRALLRATARQLDPPTCRRATSGYHLVSRKWDDTVLLDKDGTWLKPDTQTYAASVNRITLTLLGISSTIPAMALDGGKQIDGAIANYKAKITEATKVYGK